MGLLYDLTVNYPQSAPQIEMTHSETTEQVLHPETTASSTRYNNILFSSPLTMESYRYSADSKH